MYYNLLFNSILLLFFYHQSMDIVISSITKFKVIVVFSKNKNAIIQAIIIIIVDY